MSYIESEIKRLRYRLGELRDLLEEALRRGDENEVRSLKNRISGIEYEISDLESRKES